MKILYTFVDEYRIKNEILIRNIGNFKDSDIVEFFINQLICDQNTTKDVIYKKLNIKNNKTLDDEFLIQKLEELDVMFDIEVIKLMELISANIFNDDFNDLLLNIYDLYIKRYYLDVYLTGKKHVVEKTIKKRIKAFIDEKIKDKKDVYDNWSRKMHYYKKITFYKPNKHYLNSSLVNSGMLESKNSMENN